MDSAGDQLIVGADVGGTFTDLIAVGADGVLHVAKVPSTPDDPGRAVLQGIKHLCADLGYASSQVALLLHGTTVATNAVLQRRGAKTALLTTRGFRDVLEIGRQSRPRLFDFDARRSEPLIPRSRRVEVLERMEASGAISTPLEAESLDQAIRALRATGAEAIAICFLHAYKNSTHEVQAEQRIHEVWPSVSVSISSKVLPEYREYERTSTTAINAFVAPVMERYLAGLKRQLQTEAVTCPVQVMQSNGGLMSVEQAVHLPAATVLSGLAAGALGGVRLAHRAKQDVVLTLDMGGTSCDLALGVGGSVPTNHAAEVDGLPIRLPALDVHTIGAGGGSIAYLDAGAALRVGPRSAGAIPGPACYGRRGTDPTVTDANLLLGRLSETGLLGGKIPLDRSRAAEAVRRIADPLGLSVEEAAAGIIRVVNAGMARQMRVLTIERGVDPRTCTLVAFGGGGPAHAVDLARELEIPTVIVPPAPGVTSALGLLLSDYRHDRIQTALLELDRTDVPREAGERLTAIYEQLEAQVLAGVREALKGENCTVVRQAEMRYIRQGHELRVAVPDGALDGASLNDVLREFDRVHAARFGYCIPEESVLLVNALATATIPSSIVMSTAISTSPQSTVPESRPVWFGGEYHQAKVYRWNALPLGRTLCGPIIIEQLDSTTVIPPGAAVGVDDQGNLLVQVGHR